MRTNFFILLWFAFPALAAVGPTTRKLPPETWERFRSKDHGFSIELPKSWSRKENYREVALLSITNRTGGNDSFRENASVAIGRLRGNMQLPEYSQLSVQIMQRAFSEFRLKSQGDTTLGKNRAHWLRFEHVLGNMHVDVLQYLMVDKDLGYAVTFSAAPQDFSGLKNSFVRMAKSFRVKN